VLQGREMLAVTKALLGRGCPPPSLRDAVWAGLLPFPSVAPAPFLVGTTADGAALKVSSKDATRKSLFP
jgi:hypothetical protein